MTIARGELQKAAYVAETVYGTTPGTPSMLELWHNTESLRPVRQPFESGRSLGDRQLADVRMGRKSGSGDITSELTYANFEDFLVALLGSPGVTTTFSEISAATIAAAADANHDGGTFDDSGSGLATVTAGDVVVITGFTATENNAKWYVTTASAASISVSPMYVGQTAMTTEGENNTITINAVISIVNGAEEDRFSLELLYPDITTYHVYTGVMLNTGALTVPPNGIVTMNWGLLAKAYEEDVTSLGTPAIPTAYAPFDGLSGTYSEGGAANSLMTGISLNINNNIMLTEALGSDEAGEAIPRKFRADGNISFYKEDDTISAKFYGETESSLVFTLTDPDANSYTVYLPRVKYTGAEEGKGDDGPIISRMNFMVYRHPVSLKTIMIEKS